MRRRGPVLRRSRAEPAVLVAAASTVLVTATLITTLVVYADALISAGVAAVVDDAGGRQRAVEVSAPQSDRIDALDADVRMVTEESFGGLAPTIDRSLVSASFALPDGLADPPDSPTDPAQPTLTVVVGYDDLTAHARLVEGTWPGAAGVGPLPVSVHAAAAATLGLSAGDQFVLTARSGGDPLPVVVTGVHEVLDVDDPAFFGNSLETTGRDDGDFVVLGPFATTLDNATTVVPGRTVAQWRIAPDPARLDLDGVTTAARGAESVRDALAEAGAAAQGQSTRVAVESDLGDLEVAVTGPVQVSRSTVLVPMLLLGVLGALALALAVMLLAERRRTETATLRARGAALGRLAGWSAVEAAIVVLPAALLAPLLAALMLRALDVAGPLGDRARSASALDASAQPSWWLTSFTVALGAAFLLVMLTLASASGSGPVTQRSRAPGRSVLARGGIDLAVLAVAVVAWWQLRLYGIGSGDGTAGTVAELVVAAAPALIVTGVAVVVLRLMPALVAVVQLLLRRREPIGPSVALSHVARRSSRYAGPALLLVMAIAVGTLSLAYTTTWRTAQSDAAAHEAGADVRVASSARSLEALPAQQRADAYRDIDGVRAVMGVQRVSSRGSQTNSLLAVDADAAPAVMVVRDDLLGGSRWSTLTEPLVAERPTLPTVALPDDATTLHMTARLSANTADLPTRSPVLSALLSSDDGMVVRLPLGELVPDAEPTALTASLAGSSTGLPDTDVLQIVAFDLEVQSFTSGRVVVTLDVTGLGTSSADRPDAVLPLGEVDWQAAAVGPARIEPSRADVIDGDGSGFRAEMATGSEGAGGVSITVLRLTDGVLAPPAVEIRAGTGIAPLAVVTRELSEREAVTVGDQVVVDGPAGPLAVRVSSVVDQLPTVPIDVAAVLIDLSTLATLELARRADPVAAREWWLATDPAAGSDIAASAALASGVADPVVDRRASEDARLAAPLGIGPVVALGVGAIAALVVMAIGFALHGTALARERVMELSVLRTLGFSRRQLLGVLATEQGVLAACGVLLGAVAGIVAVLVLVPELMAPSLTAGGPPLRLVVDPIALSVFVVVLLLVVVAVVGGLVRSSATRDLGAALRLGEDR